MSSRKDKLFEGMNKSSQARDNLILDGKEYIEIIDLKLISPNPYQPRKIFDEESLVLLGENIKKDGLDQPIVVIKDGSTKNFILVAGERRVRASKRAGLTTIKAIVRDYDDKTMAKKALWENILREDLSMLEKYFAIIDIKVSEKINNTRELAETLNMKYTTLRRLLSIGSLDEETMNIFKDNENNVSIHTIERLSSVKSGKMSKYLKNILNKKLSKDQALEYIRALENSEPKERKQNSLYKFASNKTRFSLSIDRKNLSKEVDDKIDLKMKEIKELLENG